MKIVNPHVVIETELDGERLLLTFERIARTCYKSEDLIGPGSAERLARRIMGGKPRPHLAMLDHFMVTCRFVVDRGVSHEAVRHRIGVGYAQESTRYCNYMKEKFGSEIAVVEPPFSASEVVSGAPHSSRSPEWRASWERAVLAAERAYLEMVGSGCSPQMARSVLPTCLKTEIVISATLTAWRHILSMRAEGHAHPQMRQLMVPLLREFKKRIPVFFEDIYGYEREGCCEGCEPYEEMEVHYDPQFYPSVLGSTEITPGIVEGREEVLRALVKMSRTDVVEWLRKEYGWIQIQKEPEPQG